MLAPGMAEHGGDLPVMDRGQATSFQSASRFLGGGLAQPSMRFIIGFPIVLSVAAFVRTAHAMLALFAGKQPVFIEDYLIIVVSGLDGPRKLSSHRK